VKIVRDSYGVPAVPGDTEDRMWWGRRVRDAQDRLFELELFRRATTGASPTSPAANASPTTSRCARTSSRRPSSTRSSPRSPAAFRSTLRRLPRRDQRLDRPREVLADDMPGEFPAVGITVAGPWTVRDSVAIGVYLARTSP
jgi:hypothetical protein